MSKMTDPERLQAYISALFWNRKEAAEFLGVQERSVYRWLAGERKISPWVFRILDAEVQRQFPVEGDSESA